MNQSTYTAGAVCLDDFVSVMGQYDPTNRWNGWLNPSIDPVGVEAVRAAFEGEEEPSYTYEWREDGALILTDISQVDPETGEGETYVDIIEPDEDGLYALGYYSWTWSEDPDYGATDEWQAWRRERDGIWITASNASNRALIQAGVMDRNRTNSDVADELTERWLATHPEPVKYPTDNN